MKCVRCGRCCQDIILPFSTAGDERRWIELHGIEVIENKYGGFLKFPLKCAKLVDNKCSIYSDLPVICREFNCEDFKEFMRE